MVETLGQRIKRAIKSAGKKQNEVAGEISVTPQAVNKWIRTGKIETSHLIDLATITSVTLEWLSTGRGPMYWSQVEEESPSYSSSRAQLDQAVLNAAIEFIDHNLKAAFPKFSTLEKSRIIALLYNLFLDPDSQHMNNQDILKMLEDKPESNDLD